MVVIPDGFAGMTLMERFNDAEGTAQDCTVYHNWFQIYAGATYKNISKKSRLSVLPVLTIVFFPIIQR